MSAAPYPREGGDPEAGTDVTDCDGAAEPSGCRKPSCRADREVWSPGTGVPVCLLHSVVFIGSLIGALQRRYASNIGDAALRIAWCYVL